MIDLPFVIDVFENDIAGGPRQIPLFKTVSGFGDDIRGKLAVKYEQQALQSGFARCVDPTDIGVRVDFKLDDSRHVGVDQDNSLKAIHDKNWTVFLKTKL